MKIRAALAGVAIASLALVSTPLTASAEPMISAGPLKSVEISPDLSCDVRYVGELLGEFFARSGCGTFASIDGTLYGPEVVPETI